MHEEEMSKILVYLKGFTDQERLSLAQITALWLGSGQIPATTLRTLVNVSCCLFTFFSELICLHFFRRLVYIFGIRLTCRVSFEYKFLPNSFHFDDSLVSCLCINNIFFFIRSIKSRMD